MTEKVLDMLFQENKADLAKPQGYKDNFKEYGLPYKYFLLEMFNKQKELQTFLAERGKTQLFPERVEFAVQPDCQLAIYHLFCMQVEYNELKVELNKIAEDPETDTIDARYELIDMFFFMFNVGIYTGIDMQAVIDLVEGYTKQDASCHGKQLVTDVKQIDAAIVDLMNYIDTLPWKAWKEYPYNTFFTPIVKQTTQNLYSHAVHNMIEWAKLVFNESDKSLFDLYMNKWEENHRRQLDINAGYVLKSSDESIENSDQEA